MTTDVLPAAMSYCNLNIMGTPLNGDINLLTDRRLDSGVAVDRGTDLKILLSTQEAWVVDSVQWVRQSGYHESQPCAAAGFDVLVGWDQQLSAGNRKCAGTTSAGSTGAIQAELTAGPGAGAEWLTGCDPGAGEVVVLSSNPAQSCSGSEPVRIAEVQGCLACALPRPLPDLWQSLCCAPASCGLVKDT